MFSPGPGATTSAEGQFLSPLVPWARSLSLLSRPVRSLSPLSPPGLSVPLYPCLVRSLSPPLSPLFLDMALMHVAAETARPGLCVPLLAGIKFGLGSHVPGSWTRKGVVTWQLGLTPGGFPVIWPGLCSCSNPVSHCPEPGLPHLRFGVRVWTWQPLCAHVPLFLQDS